MIRYFSYAAANHLGKQGPQNSDKYSEDAPFAEEFVSHLSNGGVVESNQYEVDYPNLRTSLNPGEEKWEMDFENSKALYEALVRKAELPFCLLSDPRFVLYMTHVIYWRHMKSRWPISACSTQKKKSERIGTRYCMNREPLSRNEFLRLIWVPLATYDEKNVEDPYHLSFVAKKFSTTIDRILDREFSYDKRLLKDILLAVEANPDFQKINGSNEYSRKFGVVINNLLGIQFLEHLGDEEIIEIVSEKIRDMVAEIEKC